MAQLQIYEEPSQKSSVVELAVLLENAPGPMTLGDAFMQLGVLDPARQRTLSATFLRDAIPGGRFAHLIGSKLRPSTTARGRTSIVFRDVPPLTPKVPVTKRSDAFQGLRSLDKSNYSGELRSSVEKAIALNLTGNAGRAVDRMALDFDHRLELEQVKRENAEILAEERRQVAEERQKMFEEVMLVLNRVSPAPEGEANGRQVRVRTSKEAAE